MTTNSVCLYDTTLRDGSQRRGISFSLRDKLRITELLARFGITYIEGGWPGSNPKDSEYFKRLGDVDMRSSIAVAFGSTRRASLGVEDDGNIRALIAAATPSVAIVGKSWPLHVTQVLRTTLEENLRMISESVSYMKEQGREVIYDAEHFFDGYREDPEYALATLRRAEEGGADWLVLCDTNGGSLPGYVEEVVKRVSTELKTGLGIHTHDDSGLAIANSLAGVRAGCRQVQGTINGYGERCGNANLISLIPTLQLKLGIRCIPDENMSRLVKLSRTVSEIANLEPDSQAPYVGISAFSHKGGIHVAAIERVSRSYEHVDPSLIGNKRGALMSELSGRGNIRMCASEMGLDVEGKELSVLEHIKQLEGKGYVFENADGSIELFIRRSAEDYRAPFEVLDSMVVSERRSAGVLTVEAMVKLKVEGELAHTAAEGDGPVNALDRALRKALIPRYPALKRVRLSDYKVRILDPQSATSATTRVLIEAADNGNRWCTVGCDKNIIEASLMALTDSLELFLLREAV